MEWPAACLLTSATRSRAIVIGSPRPRALPPHAPLSSWAALGLVGAAARPPPPRRRALLGSHPFWDYSWTVALAGALVGGLLAGCFERQVFMLATATMGAAGLSTAVRLSDPLRRRARRGRLDSSPSGCSRWGCAAPRPAALRERHKKVDDAKDAKPEYREQRNRGDRRRAEAAPLCRAR